MGPETLWIWNELKESKATFVFGQMNEPPGARARVALSGLTVWQNISVMVMVQEKEKTSCSS